MSHTSSGAGSARASRPFSRLFPRTDLLSSLVVFIVAVPLSLGIALASGMPPVAALTAAIIGGIVIGSFSGAPIVVSGPAAGLSAMVLSYVHDYGIQAIYAITILAGVMQVIFGGLRLGRFITLIPVTLLEGVLSAIGFTILIGQLHVLMGQKQGAPGVVGALNSLPHSLGSVVHFDAGLYVAPALLCGLLALAIQLLWPVAFKRLKWIPAALPAAVVATLATLSLDAPRVVLDALGPHIFGSVERLVSGHLVASWWGLLVPAFGLAIVASAESLLTARAIDVLVKVKRPESHTNLEKELLAQGLGNMVSGIVGGMPVTGVMVRSAANMEAGATTRMSTILHGLLVAVSVVLAPALLESIPLAVLASVLVITGWRLLNIKTFVKTIRARHAEAYLWPLTTTAILATDLLKGFGFGVAVWLGVSAVAARRRRLLKSAEKQAKEVAA